MHSLKTNDKAFINEEKCRHIKSSKDERHANFPWFTPTTFKVVCFEKENMEQGQALWENPWECANISS